MHTKRKSYATAPLELRVDLAQYIKKDKQQISGTIVPLKALKMSLALKHPSPTEHVLIFHGIGHSIPPLIH